MQVIPIEDLSDPRVAEFRDVKDVDLRERRGLFVVESRMCVQRLLVVRRFAIRALLVSQSALDALGEDLDALDADTSVYLVSPETLRRVVGFPLHRGCIAVAERGEPTTLDDILAREPRVLVCLEDVANPENIGNVFRNAGAFGVDAVVLSAHCADPLYRKAIRVSMGGSLRTPFARVEDWTRMFERLRGAGLSVAALSTAAESIDLCDYRVPERVALTLGSERDGLRPETLAAADTRIRIPMADDVDSLNIATASGIALHHISQTS